MKEEHGSDVHPCCFRMLVCCAVTVRVWILPAVVQIGCWHV